VTGVQTCALPIYIAPCYLFSYHLAFQRGFDPSARRFPGILALKTRYRTDPTG
jgi:glucosamine 6-phosphate synthetase-like amidotransferase/phosphosugar isomerase protein